MKKVALVLLMSAGSICFAQKDACTILIKGMDSSITQAVLITATCVDLKDSTACGLKITGFSLVFPKAGENRMLMSESNKFTPLMLKSLKGLKKGDRFYINKIKAEDVKKKKSVKDVAEGKFVVSD